ncbi:MAG: M48 family peptidase, partial [Pseudomonadota bacterium]
MKLNIPMNILAVTLALVLTINTSVVLSNELPDLGDVSATVLTPLQEQAIAEQILREVAVSADVLQDAEVTDYLQGLGAKLVANGPDNRQKFNFFVVQDNSINAFAMPGGV